MKLGKSSRHGALSDASSEEDGSIDIEEQDERFHRLQDSAECGLKRISTRFWRGEGQNYSDVGIATVSTQPQGMIDVFPCPPWEDFSFVFLLSTEPPREEVAQESIAIPSFWRSWK